MPEKLKTVVTRWIENFVLDYQDKKGINFWRKPLVGFADAENPYILRLKEIVGPEHGLPKDVLPAASIVIACFVPFTRDLARTNLVGEPYASEEWALAYEVTNAMLGELNQALIVFLEGKGYQGDVSPEAFTFDQKQLKSNWSHRHIAYAAGLGTFGVNNMLITEAGCCGRYTTVVTNLDVEPDSVCGEEQCLYKKDGSCGVCVKHCPAGALTLEGYDRHKCYDLLKLNALKYTEFGSSYVNQYGEANSVGSEVCGKCVVYAPCTCRGEEEPPKKLTGNGE